jgi:hypothetical protein
VGYQAGASVSPDFSVPEKFENHPTEIRLKSDWNPTDVGFKGQIGLSYYGQLAHGFLHVGWRRFATSALKC